jgi:hypothetical protein
VLDPDDLARAFHEAEVRYGTTPAQVEAVLERRPNSPGAAKLRAVLRGDAPVTLSRLEKRFLVLLREDRRREREARARGDEFRRYTWGDVPRAARAHARRDACAPAGYASRAKWYDVIRMPALK